MQLFCTNLIKTNTISSHFAQFRNHKAPFITFIETELQNPNIFIQQNSSTIAFCRSRKVFHVQMKDFWRHRRKKNPRSETFENIHDLRLNFCWLDWNVASLLSPPLALFSYPNISRKSHASRCVCVTLTLNSIFTIFYRDFKQTCMH